MGHHQETGHMGAAEIEKSVMRSWLLCPGNRPHREMIREVRAQCQVCQACETTNWSTKGPMDMTPVPDQCMVHVAMDLFSIYPTTYQGRWYDSVLLCVDRMSGWIVVAPCEKKGPTSEKAAQLILEKWEMFKVPELVTSCQGQEFVGPWFRNMCA